MGRFFKKLRDIWSHEELRKRLGITLGFILIYRIGSFIVIPGVDSDTLQEQMSALGGGGLGDILSLFTGGAFSRASIFALGIMPYISASIIMQLMGLAVPSIQKMQSEGESGRKKINQWTRFLTIAITLVQAPGYLASSVVSVPGAVANPTAFWWFSAVLILTSSTLLIMYLGERITERGVGNGISLLIMIGIIATFPQAIIQEYINSENFQVSQAVNHEIRHCRLNVCQKDSECIIELNVTRAPAALQAAVASALEQQGAERPHGRAPRCGFARQIQALLDERGD